MGNDVLLDGWIRLMWFGLCMVRVVLNGGWVISKYVVCVVSLEKLLVW